MSHIKIIRERMSEQNMSQADLAWILGDSASAVSITLRGGRRLTARSAIRYGAALNLSARALLEAQSADLLARLPVSVERSEAIRERVALVEARHAKHFDKELAQLKKVRARIDARLAQLETGRT